MTTGLSAYAAAQLLDAMYNADAFSVASPHIKLHVGDPGAAGTSNAAVETTRKPVSFSAAASGAITNDAALTWTNVAGSEDYTHFSLWDSVGPAGGNFLQSGTIVAAAVVAGDTFTIAIGDLDLTVPVAA